MEKQIFLTVMSAAASGDEPTITITTSTLDRQLDEVVPEGADFTAYLRNPVVLFGHDHTALPVGTTTSLSVVAGQGVQARWSWLQGDAFADRVRNAFEQGALRAASIGFVPRESQNNRRGGRCYTKWELVEWSLCSVPANAEAIRVLRSLDLWAADESVLELSDTDAVVLDLDDVSSDLAAWVTTRAAHHWRSEPFEPVLDVDPGELRRAIRDIVPTAIARALKSAVAAEVGRVLDKHRGRVD